MRAALLFLALTSAAFAQVTTLPKDPPASTLNSNPPTLYKQWVTDCKSLFAEVVPLRAANIAQAKEITALKTQLANATTLADIEEYLKIVRYIVLTQGQSLTLLWDDNSTNETGFKVQRSTDKGATWQTPGIVAANVTSWTDTNLAPGEYWYRVRAYDATQESAFSNIAAKALP